MLRSSVTGATACPVNYYWWRWSEARGGGGSKMTKIFLTTGTRQAQYSSCWPLPRDRFCQQMYMNSFHKCFWNWIFACDSDHHQTEPVRLSWPARGQKPHLSKLHTRPLYSACRGRREPFLPRVYFVILMTHHGVSFLSACWSRHKGGGGRADNIHIAIEIKNMQKRLKALRTQVVSFRERMLHASDPLSKSLTS